MLFHRYHFEVWAKSRPDRCSSRMRERDGYGWLPKLGKQASQSDALPSLACGWRRGQEWMAGGGKERLVAPMAPTSFWDSPAASTCNDNNLRRAYIFSCCRIVLHQNLSIAQPVAIFSCHNHPPKALSVSSSNRCRTPSTLPQPPLSIHVSHKFIASRHPQVIPTSPLYARNFTALRTAI